MAGTRQIVAYYEALRRTQASLDDDVPDWEPWTGFFLRCLKKQKDRLAWRLEHEAVDVTTEVELPELSVRVLALLGEHPRRSMAELAAGTAANPNTLKLRLRELVRDGRIRQHGKGRATWYSL